MGYPFSLYFHDALSHLFTLLLFLFGLLFCLFYLVLRCLQSTDLQSRLWLHSIHLAFFFNLPLIYQGLLSLFFQWLYAPPLAWAAEESTL